MRRDKQIMDMADDVRRIRESYFGQADYLFAMKLYEDGYRKSTDLAREIFEEIEKHRDGIHGIVLLLPEELADLKKKYTEGEGCLKR